MDSTNALTKLASKFDTDGYNQQNEEMSFEEYLEECRNDPRLVRSAYQILYDMIMEAGVKEVKKYRKTYVHYNFFDDPEVPIFGLTEALHKLVQLKVPRN